MGGGRHLEGEGVPKIKGLVFNSREHIRRNRRFFEDSLDKLFGKRPKSQASALARYFVRRVL